MRLEMTTALDLLEDLADLRVGSPTAPGQADHALAPIVIRVGPGDVSEPLETPQQLVHCLLADAGALGTRARTGPLRARKLEDRDMRQAELVESRVDQANDDPAVNGVRRHAQERADERRRWRPRA